MLRLFCTSCGWSVFRKEDGRNPNGMACPQCGEKALKQERHTHTSTWTSPDA